MITYIRYFLLMFILLLFFSKKIIGAFTYYSLNHLAVCITLISILRFYYYYYFEHHFFLLQIVYILFKYKVIHGLSSKIILLECIQLEDFIIYSVQKIIHIKAHKNRLFFLFLFLREKKNHLFKLVITFSPSASFPYLWALCTTLCPTTSPPLKKVRRKKNIKIKKICEKVCVHFENPPIVGAADFISQTGECASLLSFVKS